MDAVKFVADSEDRIEGLAIPFGGPADGKDLDGETFTKDTDLALDWFPEGRPVLYNHGFDDSIGVQVIGRQTAAKTTDEGVWVEAQLNRAHRYWDKVKELVSDGKLYFSSGSVPHLVKTTGDGVIKRWPWIENSLTTTPANPYATVSVKRATAATKALGLAVPEGLIEPDTAKKLSDAIAELLENDSGIRERIAAIVENTANTSSKAEDAIEYHKALAEAHIILAEGA